MRLGGLHEVDLRKLRVVLALRDVGDDDLEPLVDDAVDAVVHDEDAQVHIRAVRERAAEETPAPVSGEDEGVQRGVAGFRADAEAERAAHRRAVVCREEADVLARPLRDVLPVLVRGADVVEADRVRTPGVVQATVELHRVDRAGSRLARDLALVERCRRRHDLGPLAQRGRQAPQDLLQHEADVAAHQAVFVAHAVTELALLVAVRVAQIGEVPDVTGVDLSQVERVLAGIEAERDHDVVLRDALPEVHRDVVPAERDVPEAIAIRRRDRVRAVHRPHRRRVEQLGETRRELADAGSERGLAADVDEHALAARDTRELLEEVGDVTRRERPRLRGPRHGRIRGSREHVGVERDGDRLRSLQHALRLAQAVLERVDAVDDDTALAQLGLELRDDVHPVLRHVLQRRVADRHRRVQRDEVDGRDVVQLRVGHPAAAELRRGTRGRHATRDAARRVPMTERREAGDVLAHREHARDAVARLREIGVRFEVRVGLGAERLRRDVHHTAAVHPREESDAPGAQDVDEHLVAACFEPGRRAVTRLALDGHCHGRLPFLRRNEEGLPFSGGPLCLVLLVSP